MDLITDSLQEIGAYAPGDTIDAPVMDISVRRLNYLIDEWAALARYAYNVAFTLYTLTPSYSPISIGPGLSSPDFATPNAATRPTRIETATLLLTGSSPGTELIVNVRDDAWWANQQVKSLTSTICTDLYYSSSFPDGLIYLWPIPTQANSLRIQTWTVVGEVDPDTIGTTDVSMPQAYRKALFLTLAEDLCTPLSKLIPASLPGRAMKARAALQSNNIASPRAASADWGTGLGRRSGFNWRSGMPS